MDDATFLELFENLGKKEEKETPEFEVIENENAIDTVIRLFNSGTDVFFLTPMDIPESFIDEILEGNKTQYITERHIELMSQYNWEFFFKEMIEDVNWARKVIDNAVFFEDQLKRLKLIKSPIVSSYF